MNPTASDLPRSRRPLRLWPGVAVAVFMVVFRLVVPLLGPGSPPLAFLGMLAGAALIILWWLFLSRAPWVERVGALVLMAAGIYATSWFLHESVARAGMGRMFPVVSVPVAALALVAWAVATRHLADRTRRASLVATILVACAGWTLVRTAGVSGAGSLDLHWRWTPTPEELLARAGDEPIASPPAAAPVAPVAYPTPAPAPLPPAGASSAPASKPSPAATAPATPTKAADWPGFRGPRRDGVVRGLQVATDWNASPPVELWRRPIGPAFSSFAVDGGLLYTMEQRAEEETVAAYRLADGRPVWRHRDRARFWESEGGVGPRATPAVHGGRVYSLGATGILNALDARTGAVLWSRNAAADTKTKNPGWGFSGSPLVVDDVLVVATGGTLVAYDLATGTPRWQGPRGRADYSSPHLVTVGGVPQVVLLHGGGATSVSPRDGKVLWEHPLTAGSRIIQPGLTGDGDLLVTNGEFGEGNGIRRIAVAHEGGAWKVRERWTSRSLKPNFNDYVVHRGYAFGFDGSILACIDLSTGERKWKGGRYGNGQLLLLADQDLLLVLSEEGELALVGATPDQHTELARRPAIAGKTWNHPVLVRDVLLVRNGQEMAAFRMRPAAVAEQAP